MAIVDPHTPLSLAEIIGSVMTSVLEAQAQAARSTAEFVEDVGLTEAGVGTDEPRRLRVARFRYTKPDENGEPREFVVEVPLLGMVDIPALSIKQARFHLTYDVATAEAAKAPAETTLGRMTKASTATLKGSIVKMRRTVAPSGIQGVQQAGGIEVSVELEKAEIPVGIERILEILENAAAEAPA